MYHIIFEYNMYLDVYNLLTMYAGLYLYCVAKITTAYKQETIYINRQTIFVKYTHFYINI